MLIEMKKVYKIYSPGKNAVCALNGIDLEIDEGEFVSVVGQSGSGKSTLMNIMGCLDVPTSGQYFLGGEDVSKLDDSRLSVIRNRTIGFIFQGFNLIPTMDAAENVALPLMYRGVPYEQRQTMAQEALERVGLGERMHHKPSEMSGGQQQRVAIARAIAARPSIILADEPTGNLDTKAGIDVMSILTELNADGKTVVLITHDPSVADLAHRTIRIVDGSIVQDFERHISPAQAVYTANSEQDADEPELNSEHFNDMLKRYLQYDEN